MKTFDASILLTITIFNPQYSTPLSLSLAVFFFAVFAVFFAVFYDDVLDVCIDISVYIHRITDITMPWFKGRRTKLCALRKSGVLCKDGVTSYHILVVFFYNSIRITTQSTQSCNFNVPPNRDFFEGRLRIPTHSMNSAADVHMSSAAD